MSTTTDDKGLQIWKFDGTYRPVRYLDANGDEVKPDGSSKVREIYIHESDYDVLKGLLVVLDMHLVKLP